MIIMVVIVIVMIIIVVVMIIIVVVMVIIVVVMIITDEGSGEFFESFYPNLVDGKAINVHVVVISIKVI